MVFSDETRGTRGNCGMCEMMCSEKATCGFQELGTRPSILFLQHQMVLKGFLRGRDSPARPSSRNSQQGEATEVEETLDHSKTSCPIERKPVKIIVQSTILCVAFLADGQRFVSGDENGKIRYWRTEDGKEVGTPTEVGSAVRSIVVSQDGTWTIAGTESGQLVVWNAQSHQKFLDFRAHEQGIKVVDISPDGTKIATGSDDKTANVFSLSDGKWLWGRRNFDFYTVKFSPDSCLFGLGYQDKDKTSALGIYNSQDGHYIGGTYISARSVAWTNDSKQLLVLSSDGNIHCVDVYSQRTLSTYPIHSAEKPTCISVSCNGTFIAASANSSISFWDMATHNQIGSVVRHPHVVECISISPNYDIVVAGGSTIVLWDLLDILSTPHDQMQHKRAAAFQIPKTDLRAIISKLRSKLTVAQHKEDALEKTINLLRADLSVQNTKSTDLEKSVQKLHTELADSQQNTERVLHVHRQKHGEEINALETANQQLRTQVANFQQNIDRITQHYRRELANIQLKAERMLWAYRQKHRCETLFADGHIVDAAESLLDITMSVSDEVKSDAIIMGWLSGFTNICVTALERVGDEASRTKKDDEALAAYAIALSLRPSSPNAFLVRWVRTMLLRRSTSEVVLAARELSLPRLSIYRATCDVLEGDGRVTEAIGCFRQMQSEYIVDADVGNERVQWELDFQRRCAKKLEKLADAASGAHDYDEANKHYSIILSLDPPNRTDILIKRSKARVEMKWWHDALKDADKVIELDPPSHLGYEQRHAALLGLKRHAEAVAAYHTMLTKLKESPDTGVREPRSQYAEVITTIRRIIHATVSPMPRILVDVTTGHLNDRVQQLKAFEALPIFNELMTSMMNEVDYAWIKKEVEEFYRYVMFSHKWEHGEPLFQQVERVTVYKLDASRGNIKLQTFCSLVRSLGFRWAWSDTCCIDKENNVVLQESLVAMFAWYRRSSLTIVHLCDISSLLDEPDGVQRSIWNTRVWTYQEYVAAKRVLFYTADWKPYLQLALDNHKESPTIRREMAMSQVSAEQVAMLQPGLDQVREKLYLASTRQTTLVEDVAYSLLGILNAPIPVIYGEGTRAVGRLLEYVLTGSGDATILAWTGITNIYNSCLPENLTVYNPLVPPHIPHMETTELSHIVMELRSSIPDHSLAITLYDELDKLPSPTIASSRLRLPGIVAHVTNIYDSGPDGRTYRATTQLLGDLQVKTSNNLTAMHDLYVVHPWIRPLLDQEFARGGARLDTTTQALRLIARIRQPFGALLFEQISRTEYKRVAADSLIMVQFRQEVLLTDLISNIRTIEVL